MVSALLGYIDHVLIINCINKINGMLVASCYAGIVIDALRCSKCYRNYLYKAINHTFYYLNVVICVSNACKNQFCIIHYTWKQINPSIKPVFEDKYLLVYALKAK